VKFFQNNITCIIQNHILCILYVKDVVSELLDIIDIYLLINQHKYIKYVTFEEDSIILKDH